MRKLHGARGPRRGAVAALASLALCWMLAARAPAPALAEDRGDQTARTLVLVLDGLPFRVVERAVRLGAFADWPRPIRLIGPFPSMTNVSLTQLLDPLGVAPTPGYELQHYDWEQNRVHGGGAFEQAESSMPWRSEIDVANRTLRDKLGTYARPARRFHRHLDLAEAKVLEGVGERVLAHVGATDALQHLHGDEATLPLLFELEERVRALRERHRRELGRELTVVLLSDHGNSHRKIRRLFRARRLLEQAGLRIRRRLEEPRDVVVGTFGVTGHAALYLHQEQAETAARALVVHEGVDLAAWQAGPNELVILSGSGRALVCWDEQEEGLRLGYHAISGDPLELSEILDVFAARGRFDEQGLAAEVDWLAATAEALYPAPLARLVEGLAGSHVKNRATVLISLQPGWAWGWKSAAVFAWLRGGALEGTHGGLDSESSVGFLLTTDERRAQGPALRHRHVLAE